MRSNASADSVSCVPKPPARRAGLLRWGDALFNEPTPLAAFRALDVPVLYMVGQHSPTSAQGVARLLCNTLPQFERLTCEELGHMGPITHAQRVNAAIARFLAGL